MNIIPFYPKINADSDFRQWNKACLRNEKKLLGVKFPIIHIHIIWMKVKIVLHSLTQTVADNDSKNLTGT